MLKPSAQGSWALFYRLLVRRNGCFFSPRYLQLENEDDYNELRAESGYDAFLLSGADVVRLVSENRIGFDWTDIRVRKIPPSGDGVDCWCYLQCVDGARWYIATEDAMLIQGLQQVGFCFHTENVLPFRMDRLKS